MPVRLSLLLLCAAVLSCDESLPPRNDPSRVIEVSFNRVNSMTNAPIDEPHVFIDPVRPPDGLTFAFRIDNVYDDPLEARLYLIARFVITPVLKPELAYTHTIVDTLGGGSLTIVPGKPVWFRYKWYFLVQSTPDPLPIWDAMVYNPTTKYPLRIGGSIQVFRNIKPVEPPPISISIEIP